MMVDEEGAESKTIKRRVMSFKRQGVEKPRLVSQKCLRLAVTSTVSLSLATAKD